MSAILACEVKKEGCTQHFGKTATPECCSVLARDKHHLRVALQGKKGLRSVNHALPWEDARRQLILICQRGVSGFSPHVLVPGQNRLESSLSFFPSEKTVLCMWIPSFPW